MRKEMDVKIIPYELAEGMGKTRKLFGNMKRKDSLSPYLSVQKADLTIRRQLLQQKME